MYNEMAVSEAINDNLEDLIDSQENVVNPYPSIESSNALVSANAEAYGDTVNVMFDSYDEYNLFERDMMLAFSGKLSHDDFFLKYRKNYEKARQMVVDSLSDRIWMRYESFLADEEDYANEI